MKPATLLPIFVATAILLGAGTFVFIHFTHRTDALPAVRPLPDQGSSAAPLNDPMLSLVLENLQDRNIGYRVHADVLFIDGRSEGVPVSAIEAFLASTPREARPDMVSAFVAGLLSSKLPIGRLRELVAHEDDLDARDPRRMLLVYHVLRAAEEQSWHQLDPGRTAGSSLAALLASAGTYSDREHGEFVTIVPSATDDKLAGLARQYLASAEGDRTLLRSRVDVTQAWLLLTFSKRAAIHALRTRDEEWMKASVAALAMEDLANGDARDDAVALALVHHCADKMGGRAAALFEEGARASGPGMARMLRDFLSRTDLAHVLQTMGWSEVKGPGGAGYATAHSASRNSPLYWDTMLPGEPAPPPSAALDCHAQCEELFASGQLKAGVTRKMCEASLCK